MDEIQACILNSKIKLFKNEIKLRNNVAAIYEKLLCNKKDILYLPKVEKFNYSVYAQYTIVVKNRKKLLKALIEKKHSLFNLLSKTTL